MSLLFYVFILTFTSILLPLLLISNSLLLLRFLLDHFLLFYMPCIFFFFTLFPIFSTNDRSIKKIYCYLENSMPFYCQASMCGDQKQSDCRCRGVGQCCYRWPHLILWLLTMGFYYYYVITMGFLCALVWLY